MQQLSVPTRYPVIAASLDVYCWQVETWRMWRIHRKQMRRDLLREKLIGGLCRVCHCTVHDSVNP